jgi:hypothetical protein
MFRRTKSSTRPTTRGWRRACAEPVEFFREMFGKNLPIESFIDSDWTVANARLCDFYGLPEPKTGGFQRVSLKPEDRRGGLLTMGAVLGLTSDGTRHRPVHRGVWLSEAILGKTPPPPPANVPAIEPNPPERRPKVTCASKLEAHASDANCAACHAKIDPLGLAWDNYDAIGQWRTREKVPDGTGRRSRSSIPPASCPTVVPSKMPASSSNSSSKTATRSPGPSSSISAPTPSAARAYDDQDDIDQIVEAKKRIRGQRHRPRRGNVGPDEQDGDKASMRCRNMSPGAIEPEANRYGWMLWRLWNLFCTTPLKIRRQPANLRASLNLREKSVELKLSTKNQEPLFHHSIP